MRVLNTVARGIGTFGLLLACWAYAVVAIVVIGIVFFFDVILRKD